MHVSAPLTRARLSDLIPSVRTLRLPPAGAEDSVGVWNASFTRQTDRGHMGTVRNSDPGGLDRPWLPQSESLRRGFGRIHLRDAFCDFRNHVPVRDVAPAS